MDYNKHIINFAAGELMMINDFDRVKELLILLNEQKKESKEWELSHIINVVLDFNKV
jgi:hypothetical protein